MRTCGQWILPAAGRLVIFETSLRAMLHAVDSVRCPPERARLALISRYYSEVPGPRRPPGGNSLGATTSPRGPLASGCGGAFRRSCWNCAGRSGMQYQTDPRSFVSRGRSPEFQTT